MAEPCDICGGTGLKNLAATCTKFGARRHVYCMQTKTVLEEVPDVWSCEECNKNRAEIVCDANSFGVVGNKREKQVNSGKVKFISSEEAIMLKSGTPKMESRSCLSTRMHTTLKKTPLRPKTISIKSLLKTESTPTLKPSPLLLPPKQFSEPHVAQASKEFKEAKIPEACVMKTFSKKQALDVPKLANEHVALDTKLKKVTDKASRVSSPKMSDGSYLTDAEVGKPSAVENTLISNEQYHGPNLARKEATWKGKFKITSSYTTPGNLCDGFVAYPPARVHPKAYEFSKSMPPVIQFTFMPRRNIWADIFQDDDPVGDDIALYITPGDFKRSLEHYTFLLETMDNYDSVISCNMGSGVEFLVFTSKVLDMDFQKLHANRFLWGVFRHDSHCKKNEEVNMNISTEVDMEIDMIGGVDI